MADGESVVECYTIPNMAQGPPRGTADNDQRYGAQGAFLIDAGISSSYHIASFFGLTERIHRPKDIEMPAPTVEPTAAAPKTPALAPTPASPPPNLTKLPRPSLTRLR